MKTKAVLLLATTLLLVGLNAQADSKKEYQNRVKLMLDFAVRTNEYVRQRLMDKKLVAYSHEMAEKNASLAERMTPPKQLVELHPHFLLVLENVERSLFYAEQGKISDYRHHQRIVRRELQILEALAERVRLELYIWDK